MKQTLVNAKEDEKGIAGQARNDRPFRMKTYFQKSSLIGLFVLFTIAPAFAQKNVPEGFVSLFNGKDFTGWDINPNKGAWTVKNGIMHCAGAPNVPYIILTEKKYENFELMLEFKMTPECNSGVMLHQSERSHGRESRIGMEIQVNDNAGREVDAHTCAAIYDVVPPLANPVKPVNHWNTYYILMDWPILQVHLNGQLVQDVNLEKNPRLQYRLRNGYIGLQNHEFEVEYRNLYIKELPAKEKWIDLFNGKDLNGWKVIGDAEWKVENNEIVATGGNGYLVSDESYEKYEFQIFAGKLVSGGNSGVFYNWNSPSDAGYKTEFVNWGNKPEHDFLLTQIINKGKESLVIMNGEEVQKNLYQTSVRKSPVAIYHSANDGKLRIAMLRIKSLVNGLNK
jgi:hypothetical protein